MTPSMVLFAVLILAFSFAGVVRSCQEQPTITHDGIEIVKGAVEE